MKKCPQREAEYIPNFFKRIEEKKHFLALKHKFSLSTEN